MGLGREGGAPTLATTDEMGVTGLGGKQGIEAARAIERMQVIATADMALADKNLRNRPPTRLRNHFLLAIRVLIDVNLVDVGNAFGAQQRLGPLAVGTPIRCIHLDFGHDDYFSTGRPAAFQAVNPPLKLTTLAKPCFFKIAIAPPARWPLAQ